MNRLWVRLSLLYTSVLLIVVLLILTLLFVISDGPPDRSDILAASPDFTAAQVDAILLLSETGMLQSFFRSIVSAQLVLFSTLTIVIGILGSIWMSYRMTRPLTELEEAARQVGAHDLSYRVTISGTAEMVALANSFNGMAAALESAENRRQNLLADVSHELRTPLTVLQGNLRAALDEVTLLDPPQITKLYDHTRQLNHLINDLHDLAQAEANRLSLNMMAIDLTGLLAQAAELFAPLAEDDGIHITSNLPLSPAIIQGDRARLMQIIQNLISNALRYAHSTIDLTLIETDKQFRLTIADDGSGIAPQHLAHIFDRFYRADSSRARQTGGTGLGLAIVKSLVEAHSGTIEAQSVLGQGTKMVLCFPNVHKAQKAK